MNPYFRVVSSVVVLVLIGCVSTDQQSGEINAHQQGGESSVARPSCPFATDTEAKIRSTLIGQLISCYKSPNGTDFTEGLRHAETTDDIRAFFRRFCGMKTFTRRCAANVTALSASCLDENQRTAVEIHATFVRSAYEVGCTQGGEKAANAVVDGWRLNNGSLDGVVNACVHVAANRVVLRGATDVTVISTQNYRMLRALKECILAAAPRGSSMANFADVIIADILKALTCIDQYQVVVSCKQLTIID